MPKRSDSKTLNLDVSKLVPEPMTLCWGRPLSFHATNVKTSTLFSNFINIVSGYLENDKQRVEADNRNCSTRLTRIAYDQQYGVRTVLNQFGNNIFEYVRVSLDQIQPGFSIFLPGTRRHYTYF